MDGKLTLSIQPEVISKAKVWARRKGASLSALVEDFLKGNIEADAGTDDPLAIIKKFAAKQPTITDVEIKQRIHEHRTKKYGGA